MASRKRSIVPARSSQVDYLFWVSTRWTYECQPVMFGLEVVKPLQTQFLTPLIAPEADSVAAGMVAQPGVMEEGNRRFQLCFWVFDPEVKGILVLEGFQAPFGRFGRGIFGRHRAVDGEYYDLPWRFSVEGPVWKVVREDLATAVAILGRGHQFLGGASVSQSNVIPGYGFLCIGFLTAELRIGLLML